MLLMNSCYDGNRIGRKVQGMWCVKEHLHPHIHNPVPKPTESIYANSSFSSNNNKNNINGRHDPSPTQPHGHTGQCGYADTDADTIVHATPLLPLNEDAKKSIRDFLHNQGIVPLYHSVIVNSREESTLGEDYVILPI